MDKEKSKLPYHADIGLFDKMINDLKTTGPEGVNLDTMWADIGATKDNLRSFALNLGKYVDLVDSDNKKIWLTELGTTLRYMSKDERSKILASKLPDKYRTMFKWIHADKELRSNEIKRKFIETWGNIISPSVLDRVISTFLNYCAWIGIVTYQGRGIQAKGIITELGKRVLDYAPEVIMPKPRNEERDNESGEIKLLDGKYPILIKTKDRDFDWDVKSEKDWEVVNSVIASIKEGWQKLQQQSPSKKGDVK